MLDPKFPVGKPHEPKGAYLNEITGLLSQSSLSDSDDDFDLEEGFEKMYAEFSLLFSNMVEGNPYFREQNKLKLKVFISENQIGTISITRLLYSFLTVDNKENIFAGLRQMLLNNTNLSMLIFEESKLPLTGLHINNWIKDLLPVIKDTNITDIIFKPCFDIDPKIRSWYQTIIKENRVKINIKLQSQLFQIGKNLKTSTATSAPVTIEADITKVVKPESTIPRLIGFKPFVQYHSGYDSGSSSRSDSPENAATISRGNTPELGVMSSSSYQPSSRAERPESPLTESLRKLGKIK